MDNSAPAGGRQRTGGQSAAPLQRRSRESEDAAKLSSYDPTPHLLQVFTDEASRDAESGI